MRVVVQSLNAIWNQPDSPMNSRRPDKPTYRDMTILWLPFQRLDAYRVANGRGSPVHSPLTFDLTVTSLLSPLCAGRAITLIREDVGGAGLADSLRGEGGYSLVKLTPAHLALLGQAINDGAAAAWSNLFVVGGEALTNEILRPWQRR